MTTPNEREAREPMFGAMLEADFEKNTVTFEMCGEYYAAAGLYEIRPHVAALTREQREGVQRPSQGWYRARIMESLDHEPCVAGGGWVRFVCSNPERRHPHASDPQGPCPSCVAEGVGNWSCITLAAFAGSQPQREATAAVACAEDAGEFSSDTAALAFLRLTGNGNPNVERAVERLRLSLTTPQPGDGVVVPRALLEQVDSALMWDLHRRPYKHRVAQQKLIDLIREYAPAAPSAKGG